MGHLATGSRPGPPPDVVSRLKLSIPGRPRPMTRLARVAAKLGGCSDVVCVEFCTPQTIPIADRDKCNDPMYLRPLYEAIAWLGFGPDWHHREVLEGIPQGHRYIAPSSLKTNPPFAALLGFQKMFILP